MGGPMPASRCDNIISEVYNLIAEGKLKAKRINRYRDGKLRYFGHSGTGFSEKGLKEAIDRLRPLFIDESPVENPPKIPEKIRWVQPKLVCEVAFAEWTTDERLRQTTFLGVEG
jgi:bifunctional non-homologous end joining protein LigD